MQHCRALIHKKLKGLWGIPAIQVLVPGFGLSLAWEILQSPLYADTFEASWCTLAYNRLHCAGGDALLLLIAFWIVALRWGQRWVSTARRAPCAVFLSIGLAYTTVSEHVNVHLVRRWTYSPWMPTVAGVGLVPLLQWVVVPTLTVWRVRRRSRQESRQAARRVASRAGAYASRTKQGRQGEA